LTLLHPHLRGIRQIYVQPASEPDKPETFAPAYALTPSQRTKDTPRHQPGDLYHNEVFPTKKAEPDGHALVVLASLIE
jgi:hypothetical protein